MHMQRKLKMSRIYSLAEILSQIFVKKKKKKKKKNEGKLGPYLRSWFDKLMIWCQLNFY